MGKRHETIGIKQAIRIEWMQKAANLLLAGLGAKSIRQELHELLADKKGSGSDGERGNTSRTQVVNMLMKTWVSPDCEVVPHRDASLLLLQEYPSMSLPVHWGMISAAYPFWYNVAKQAGRLLNLQDQIAQVQIFSRLKEQYGDRETVSRYARYVVRSFIAWGVLKDSKAKGCYEKVNPLSVPDSRLIALMLESALYATPDAKGTLGLLLNNPAFFPFQLPVMTCDSISQHSNVIEVVRHGLDDELLKLKTNYLKSL